MQRYKHVHICLSYTVHFSWNYVTAITVQKLSLLIIPIAEFGQFSICCKYLYFNKYTKKIYDILMSPAQ